MNRIYQGRVNAAEEVNEAGDANALEDWPQKLWHHHVLFQDAVNYYAFALLALAAEDSRLFPLRARLAAKKSDGSDHDLAVWERVRRRGTTRPGLRDSVAKYLGCDPTSATPEECFAAILKGNAFVDTAAGREMLNRGLQQVLNYCAKRNMQKAAPEFFPRFCNPDFTGTFQEDSNRLTRDALRPELLRVLHDPDTGPRSPALDRFGPDAIALLKGGEMDAEKSRAKLRAMLADWRREFPEAEVDWIRLGSLIEALPSETKLPDYAGTSAKGQERLLLYAMFFFRLLERSEFTIELMRRVSRAPKENKNSSDKSSAPQSNTGSSIDPIRASRAERGYVFRAFTSLPDWDGDESGEPRWLPFDVAAFEEALKALHQMHTKGDERAKERERLEHRQKAMRGEVKWKKPSAESKEEPPPLLKGDQRIERIESIVDRELKQEYEATEGIATEYGLHPRTIRGFRDLRRAWNKQLANDKGYSPDARNRLLAELRDYQKENPQIIGSVRLFEELLKEENCIVWRELDEAHTPEWWKPEFAADPLAALTEERLLKRDIARLGEPVRFTPADPVYSRRQFYFNEMGGFRARGAYHHEPNQCTVLVPLAQRQNGTWCVTRVRLHYSAPRLLRDHLREETNEQLTSLPFLQPMMEALGIAEPAPQDFSACAVALMPEELPSGARRVLLNFPNTIDEEPLAKKIGMSAKWEKEFVEFDDAKFYLRWPSLGGFTKKSTSAKPAPQPWWERLNGFHCLAVDLGQRDAGAFALLDVRANHDFGRDKNGRPRPTRIIGTTSNAASEKVWRAYVAEKGLLRLPGEDARVLRKRTEYDAKNPDDPAEEKAFREELYGERGRKADADEWAEAQAMCERLGFQSDDIVGSDPEFYSFPELNSRLLFALRRAQTHLARYQRWSWMIGETDKVTLITKDNIEREVERREKTAQEIAESDDESEELKLAAAAEKKDWAELENQVVAKAEALRQELKRAIVQIADRVLPLRGRRWEWAERIDATRCHVLRQTARGTDERKKKLMGQRGLSMERIEQLEDLRQRCQSLNRALRHTPGVRGDFGRKTRGEELPDPCPEILDKLEEIREQRVNQTAHLILARALGVRLKAPQKDPDTRRRHDIHGEYEKFREAVDFIILEDLSRYLSSQGRTRTENSRLMQWSHRAILKKLKDLCTAYGIPVVEATASYSSRFCSRTAVAGFRAVEITNEALHEWRWRRPLERLAIERDRSAELNQMLEAAAVRALDPDRVTQLETKLDKARAFEAEQLWLLFQELTQLNRGRRAAGKPLRTLLAPMPGGPIFFPVQDERYGTRRSPMQADINAAINLGVRAIAAPECHDIHVRIRGELKDGTFSVRADTTREKARWNGAKPKINLKNRTWAQSLAKESAHPNFFIDRGYIAKFDWGRIEGLEKMPISSGRALWSRVRREEWKSIHAFNAARLQRFSMTTPPPMLRPDGGREDEEDNIPM